MSEVDRQRTDRASDAAVTDDWQTVDCPDAISVDAIPRDDSPIAADPITANPVALLPTTVADLTALVQQLQQENGEQRDRLHQSEQALMQGQTEWQLPAQRQPSDETETQPAQDLTVTQERLGHLFQELELSHQTAQRQQILMETFTEQLATSQERIAQLERECAIAQQRCNEQVQQRLQAETACRDLQMRLQRQQQHTLQFKVALEKCLEVPAPTFAGRSQPDSPIAVPAPDHQALKNQPVQPWSAPTPLPIDRMPSLSKLLQESEQPADLPLPAIGAAEADTRFDDLVSQRFPCESGSDGASLEGAAALNQSPVEAVPLPDLDAADASREALNQANPTDAANPTTAIAEPDRAVAPLKCFDGAATAASAPRSLLAGSPSPVVYPERPSKKLKSLAAVDLPTFPRPQ